MVPEGAEQGTAGAQFNMGLMYAVGEAVPQDDIEACAWMMLSGVANDARRKPAWDVVSKRLAPEALAKARLRAKELQAEIKKKAEDIGKIPEGKKAQEKPEPKPGPNIS